MNNFKIRQIASDLYQLIRMGKESSDDKIDKIDILMAIENLNIKPKLSSYEKSLLFDYIIDLDESYSYLNELYGDLVWSKRKNN